MASKWNKEIKKKLERHGGFYANNYEVSYFQYKKENRSTLDLKMLQKMKW